GVPLVREGIVIGVVAVWRSKVRDFTERQIELVKTFADQAVIAIENARLVQELQESLEQQTAMSEILSVISRSPTDIQPVLDAIVEHACRLCKSDTGAIYRMNGKLMERGASYGIEEGVASVARGRGPQRADASSVMGQAVAESRTIHVPDVTDAPVGSFSARMMRVAKVRTALAVPLLREGAPIGVMGLWRTEPDPFSDRQIDLVQTFADQAVIAIENVRLFTELQLRTEELAKSVERLQALGEVGQAVSSTLDLQQVLSTILSRAVQLSSANSGTIYEFESETGRLVNRAVQGMSEEDAQALQYLGGTDARRFGDSLIGQAALRRRPMQTPDMLDPKAENSHLLGQLPRMREVYTRLGMRAALAMPLLLEDKVLGAIMVRRNTPGAFPDETVDLLQTLASQSAIAIQNARLFSELEQKSLELEIASRHKSQFLANMSHELRTPLNAIIGFSEMLTKQMLGELTPEQIDVTQDVLNAGRHLLALINDILDLSKVEAGRMELELSTFSLPAALDMGLTMVKERAAGHGIQLSLELEPGIGDVQADERKVKQILLNLLSNAVKFTPDGGSIALKARHIPSPAAAGEGQGEGTNFVEISVTDTGVGITPEDHDKVFEEFEQVGTVEAVKKEGTGLGLPLAKRFVELHGGRMWLESEVGRGSTFAFMLPTKQGARGKRQETKLNSQKRRR
ncbi:MAG TPA: GAF domain-containing protein, partial [Chloroflexota bacterium]